MATTFPIPLTTLAVGTHTFGPASIADTDSFAEISIDRTVAGGFNSLTSAVTAYIEVDQSNDGGVTWQQRASTTFAGGIYQTKAPPAGQLNTNYVQVSLAAGTGRLGRATVVIGGGQVAVQGSLIIS